MALNGEAYMLFQGDGSNEPGFVPPVVGEPPPPPPARMSSGEAYIPYPPPPSFRRPGRRRGIRPTPQ